jgi:hypothetical protein
VYVRPDRFEPARTGEIAAELAQVNRWLVNARVPYLLIGFGRWGSADPWLGIPVSWSAISGARVVVEATSPALSAQLSQGSHFFHNMAGFEVSYFSVGAPAAIDWSWLTAQPARHETRFLRHIRLDAPLLVKVDGRSGRGVVLRTA